MIKCLFVMWGIFLFLPPESVTGQNYEINDQMVTVKVNTVTVNVEIFSPALIRILKYPEGIKTNKASLSVIKEPEQTEFKVTESKSLVNIQTKVLKVRIDKGKGTILFYDSRNNQLLKEIETPLMFTSVPDIDQTTFSVRQNFRLSAEEGIYGLGQDQKGVMNYRNHKVQLRQSNMFVANPFMLSTKGYGIFWDNYSESYFSDDPGITSFNSVIGNCIDYYFVFGSTPDSIIKGYRELTGQSPMFGKWAFGFWQSRERYVSQNEIISIVEKYRNLKIPLDNIVQDWRYWGETGSWNSTEFGNPLFPDPKGMIDKIHNLNAHIMISVWPSFGEKTAIYRELKDKGMLFDFTTWPPEGGVRVYDAFNPHARDIYWKYMNKNIFSQGMDAWWLDATEPEQGDRKGKTDSVKTYFGSFKQFRNAFPLMTNKGVYENQRKASSDKRVFILTRSAFAGQQRYASAVWSGDIDGNWETFRKQIPGGLNFCMSGMPYWTTDIGGFFVRNELYPGGVADPAYQELYVRWFQFGTFCPLFRSHGTSTPREIFNFGSKGYWAYDVQEKFINLRYRLLPYIYSLGWRVTSDGYTVMRGLPMDFVNDPKVFNVDNQYMFGPSIMVCPVTKAMYTQKTENNNGTGKAGFSDTGQQVVYLPKSNGWFDFWTGERKEGGIDFSRQVPIDIMPIYIKAGSILPMGPFMQYATEKPADPLELRIYTGADAEFMLYEDENDNYNYEKGAYSIIPLKWDEKKQALTIGDRLGNFTGMPKERTFNIIFVDTNHGVGINIDDKPDEIVHYSGMNNVIKRK